MPRTVLFVTLMGYGHVNPTLPIVRELTSRHHRVHYATSPEHRPAVVQAGAEWVTLPSPPPFTPAVGDMRRILVTWFEYYFSVQRIAYPLVRDWCDAHQPDIICYDGSNWYGRLVARVLGIPAIRLLPHLASNDHFSLDLGLTPADPMLRDLAAECDRFAAEYELSFDVSDVFDAIDERNLIFVPREFQPAGETFDEQFRFVGPTVPMEPAEQWSPRELDQPLVYISLGSAITDADFYRACISAFEGAGWQVAMTVGDVEIGDVPEFVEIRSSFPQLAVLKHASVFVTHAGMNSVMEALYNAVPMVAVPFTPEQEINAERVRELGLGETLGDVEQLVAVVERVAEDRSIRDSLAAMQRTIQAYGGAVEAADEIERC